MSTTLSSRKIEYYRIKIKYMVPDTASLTIVLEKSDTRNEVGQ